MNCKRSEELSLYFDGLMESVKRPDMERHISSCPLCSSELSILEAIKNTDFDEPLPQGFAEKVMAKIDEDEKKVIPVKRFYRMPFTVAAVAVIAIVLGLNSGYFSKLTGFYYGNSTVSKQDAATQQSESRVYLNGASISAAPQEDTAKMQDRSSETASGTAANNEKQQDAVKQAAPLKAANKKVAPAAPPVQGFADATLPEADTSNTAAEQAPELGGGGMSATDSSQGVDESTDKNFTAAAPPASVSPEIPPEEQLKAKYGEFSQLVTLKVGASFAAGPLLSTFKPELVVSGTYYYVLRNSEFATVLHEADPSKTVGSLGEGYSLLIIAQG